MEGLQVVEWDFFAYTPLIPCSQNSPYALPGFPQHQHFWRHFGLSGRGVWNSCSMDGNPSIPSYATLESTLCIGGVWQEWAGSRHVWNWQTGSVGMTPSPVVGWVAHCGGRLLELDFTSPIISSNTCLKSRDKIACVWISEKQKPAVFASSGTA